MACATLLHLFKVKNVHSATSCGKLCLALSLSLASLCLQVYNLEICVTDWCFASGPSEETAVYAFGSNRRGQLGIEIPQQPQTQGTKNVACISKPQSITTLNSKKLVAISANGDHSAALTGLCFSAREVCTTCGFYLHG